MGIGDSVSVSVRNPVIVASHLRKSYGRLVAVDELDLEVNRGEIYGLIGPNGAGKTTLIKMLVGILEPDDGSVSVLGRSALDPSTKIMTGYMPQEVAIYPDLTVMENLRFFAGISGVPKGQVDERIGEVVDLVDLGDRVETVTSSLSGGMRHRLSLAISLVHDPDLLFLDEPTVGVDPELRVSFWSHFYSLAEEGKTILISTHYMEEASGCMRVGMMHRGSIIAEGEPGELVSRTGSSGLEEVFLNHVRGGVVE